MKKHYVKPMMVGEEFLANEFVSTCGDTEYGVYKFTCNAGGGANGGLYIGKSHTATEYWGIVPIICGCGVNHGNSVPSGTYWSRVSNSASSYHACNDTHETSVRDEYKEGIFDPDTDHTNGNEIECLIWYHNGSYQGHASTGLTRDQWEVLKS